MKIGEYRIIPKGTKFWSIALQAIITLDDDYIVKITNLVCGNGDYFFGNLQDEFFKHMIPTLVDKTNGEIGINYSETKKYYGLKNTVQNCW
jgi:hypothetical protein